MTGAHRHGDHSVVRGTKTWITNGRHAHPLASLIPSLVKTDPDAEPSHAGMSVMMIEA
jgi:alkylation response protein AidB-like acyl-CoA dehydrogenase